MTRKKQISKNERLALRSAAYFEIWMGASAVWIAPCQHLLMYKTDTDKDNHFLDRDRLAFVNHQDTIEMIAPDGRTVYVNAKCPSELAEKAMRAFFSRKTQTVDFKE